MNKTEDRQRVRTLLNVNMVVEAGAGTGKTTLLIDRLCFALLAQGILAPRLVALTFTEKAAAEIKTRLIFKLQAVLQAARENKPESTLDTLREYFQVPAAQIIARAERALSQLDISPIGTIHSFCADILRTYPLEAGLTPGAEIDKGPRAQRVFEAEWNKFLDRELGESAPRPRQWQEVLSKVSLADLRACAQEMCSGKMQSQSFSLPKEKLIKKLQSSDLYVHSATVEIEAIAAIEAIACGLVPVIAESGLSATKQFALNEKSLFADNDDKELAQKIDYWYEHHAERASMSGRYAVFAKKFSLKNSLALAEQMFADEISEYSARKLAEEAEPVPRFSLFTRT